MDSWTDERLDDLAATLSPLPAQVARNTEAIDRMSIEMRAMRQEMREMRGEMREEMRAMRADLLATQRQMTQIGWGFAAALVIVVVTQLLTSL